MATKPTSLSVLTVKGERATGVDSEGGGATGVRCAKEAEVAAQARAATTKDGRREVDMGRSAGWRTRAAGGSSDGPWFMCRESSGSIRLMR